MMIPDLLDDRSVGVKSPLARSAIVRNFTPNWFAATMGTGILALDLNQVPDATHDLHIAAQTLWLANIGLFILFSALYTARWLMFRREAARIFSHSAMSMFLGTIPMGLATIVNGFVVFGASLWGHRAITIATSLWWIDVSLSLIVGLGVPFLMMVRQDHVLERMTAIWLLPVVAAEVAAASGAGLVPHIVAPLTARAIDIICYALWAYSVPLALGLIVILLLRLILHKLPHHDMAPSSWLALGPIGTGALGLLLLGADAPQVFAGTTLGVFTAGIQTIGLVGGLMLWGYGVWWLGFAVLATIRYLRTGIAFNLGWWGFTFPLGVYASATFALARQLHFALFEILACGFTALLAVLWLIVAVRTTASALYGRGFVSPCLATGSIPDDFAAVLPQRVTRV